MRRSAISVQLQTHDTPAIEVVLDLVGCTSRGWLVEESKASFTKAQELRSFLFLSIVMAPVLAVIFVSGYGFVVWMYQLVAGPPGS